MENNIEIKDKDEKVMVFHFALRSVGYNVSYNDAELAYNTFKATEKKGGDIDLLDLMRIKEQHHNKWTKYFNNKENKLELAFRAGYVSACNEESYDKGLKKFIDNAEKLVKG